jgi:hypothetical protein
MVCGQFPSTQRYFRRERADRATVRDGMIRAFVRASQLEWMFWDSAHRLESWPV